MPQYIYSVPNEVANAVSGHFDALFGSTGVDPYAGGNKLCDWRHENSRIHFYDANPTQIVVESATDDELRWMKALIGPFIQDEEDRYDYREHMKKQEATA